MARSLLAAGDAGADEVKAFRFYPLRALLSVLEPGVATVDQDVAAVEKGHDLLDGLIDGRAGLDHHHDSARPLDRFREVLKRLRPGDFLSAVFRDELVDLLGIQVPHCDGKTVLLDVEGEVLPHHAQADHAKLRGHTLATTAFFTDCARRSRPRSTS